MAARFLKVSYVATAVLASSGIYVYNRQQDFSDLSVLRFGRAAVAVSHSTFTISQTLSRKKERVSKLAVGIQWIAALFIYCHKTSSILYWQISLKDNSYLPYLE